MSITDETLAMWKRAANSDPEERTSWMSRAVHLIEEVQQLRAENARLKAIPTYRIEEFDLNDDAKEMS